jgi:hypothetical protein
LRFYTYVRAHNQPAAALAHMDASLADNDATFAHMDATLAHMDAN